MLTNANLFEQELRKILNEQIEKARDRLETAPFDSIGGFESVRGEVRAYREMANTIIDEAKSNVEKRVKG